MHVPEMRVRLMSLGHLVLNRGEHLRQQAERGLLIHARGVLS
jgi:hypothetical protein